MRFSHIARMVERRLTGMITAAAVLIVLFIVWDMFVRSRGRRFQRTPVPSRWILPCPPRRRLSRRPDPAVHHDDAGGAVPAGPDGREPTYIELLARSETRRRIR